MKRSFYALLCAMLMFCTLVFVASCGGDKEDGGHTHTWAAATCTSPKKCSCGVTEGAALGHKNETTAAVAATCTQEGAEADGTKCTVCGVVTKKATVIPMLEHVDENNDRACDVCGANVCKHENIADTMSKGNSKHWKACLDCGDKVNEASHVYEGEVCNVCNYDAVAEGHYHEFDTEWSADANSHWKASICGHTILVDSYELHSDEDGDSTCDVCDKIIIELYDPGEKYATYNWDVTDIYICLNENSNNKELSSELRRYLAGDTTEEEEVDDLVAERNQGALDTAKVNVIYVYWGEGDQDDAEGARWGTTITRTIELVMANAPGSPDIFVNQIYDMVSASLQKCFANIRTTKLSGGDNNFSFTEDEYVEFAEAYGEEYGYMMEYMSELGFSVKKQYLIASDYFIDLVRAFFVVPMNLNLLSSIDEDATTGDLDGNGKFNVDDFYKMVRQGDWTYSTLVQYSEAVYSNLTGSQTGSIDDINGFILTPSNGMISSALLYTTSITIFERKEPNEDGFFRCIYPDTNEDLFAFCNALAEMVSATGVHVERVDHLKIRDRFTADKVLFGGIILLGSLEYQEYQDMKNKGGFGILPVPVYKEGDNYLTLIHNMGRIAAIRANTTAFAQCSAYIDYQTTHSSKILNEYYEYKLQYDMAGGTSGNIEILNYIRENVRSAFDKTYEDAIGYYFKGTNPNASKESWAGILSDKDFKVTTMRDLYVTNKESRDSYLEEIIKAYEVLPE